MEMPRSSASGVEEVQAGAWGLGDRRTLDQFIEFTGVSGWWGSNGIRSNRIRGLRLDEVGSFCARPNGNESI